MSEYCVEPAGAFVEVPYPLLSAWTSGGYTWAELVAANGLPPAVRARLTMDNVRYCERTVSVWPSHEAYSRTVCIRNCRAGRAWLGPGTDGPVRLLTGVMHAPVMRSRFGRWRW